MEWDVGGMVDAGRTFFGGEVGVLKDKVTPDTFAAGAQEAAADMAKSVTENPQTAKDFGKSLATRGASGSAEFMAGRGASTPAQKAFTDTVARNLTTAVGTNPRLHMMPALGMGIANPANLLSYAGNRLGGLFKQSQMPPALGTAMGNQFSPDSPAIKTVAEPFVDTANQSSSNAFSNTFLGSMVSGNFWNYLDNQAKSYGLEKA